MLECLVIREALLRGIRMCGLVRWKCATRVGFEVSKDQANPSVLLFLLLVDPVVEFSAFPPGLCVPVCCHATYCDENGLNL